MPSVKPLSVQEVMPLFVEWIKLFVPLNILKPVSKEDPPLIQDHVIDVAEL